MQERAIPTTTEAACEQFNRLVSTYASDPTMSAFLREDEMRKLIYAQMTSLDGFIEAEPNRPQNWAGSGKELIRHFIELEESVDAHLYGRRTYQHLAAAAT